MRIAAVYVTAVLEYLTAEVLELAGVSSFIANYYSNTHPFPRIVGESRTERLVIESTRTLTKDIYLERRQRSQSQKNHPSSSPTRHPWRRGTRYLDPSHHRLWRRTASYQPRFASQGRTEEEKCWRCRWRRCWWWKDILRFSFHFVPLSFFHPFSFPFLSWLALSFERVCV